MQVGDEIWIATGSAYYGDCSPKLTRINEIKESSEGEIYYCTDSGNLWKSQCKVFSSEEDAKKYCDSINAEYRQSQKIRKEIQALVESENYVKDGIYDVSKIEFILVDDENSQEKLDEVKTFVKKYPNFAVGIAYETYTKFLLSDTPPKFKGEEIGSGFNYGSTNILVDCPKAILILAEND